MAARLKGFLSGRDSFRRLLAWSLGGHMTLALLAVIPLPHLSSRRPPAVFVDLVAAPAARPRPAPRQVVAEPKVISDRPRPKPKPKPAPAKPEPPPPTAEEILAQLRAKHPARPEEPPSVVDRIRASVQRGSGRVDPILAAYTRKIESCVHANWVGASSYTHRSDLEVRFAVSVDSAGALTSVAIIGTSGDRFLDESAERAILKCEPFPPPPRGYERLVLAFSPYVPL